MRYDAKLTAHWAIKVEIATEERVALSRTTSYVGKGEGRALGRRGGCEIGGKNTS
jgi:hypothetical protein